MNKTQRMTLVAEYLVAFAICSGLGFWMMMELTAK